MGLEQGANAKVSIVPKPKPKPKPKAPAPATHKNPAMEPANAKVPGKAPVPKKQTQAFGAGPSSVPSPTPTPSALPQGPPQRPLPLKLFVEGGPKILPDVFSAIRMWNAAAGQNLFAVVDNPQEATVTLHRGPFPGVDDKLARAEMGGNEVWIPKNSKGVYGKTANVTHIVAHELGHILGLDHAPWGQSVMAGTDYPTLPDALIARQALGLAGFPRGEQVGPRWTANARNKVADVQHAKQNDQTDTAGNPVRDLGFNDDKFNLDYLKIVDSRYPKDQLVRTANRVVFTAMARLNKQEPLKSYTVDQYVNDVIDMAWSMWDTWYGQSPERAVEAPIASEMATNG